MHHLIFGHSFAELEALVLLLGLTFYFLNKKKASVHGNAEDADIGGSGSLTAPTGTNSGGSSSSPTKTNNGSSSSSTAPTGNSYEVFLSFRGLDTRNSFADHLYNGLLFAGIHAFRDDEELRQGEKIGLDLLEAIKNSKILIPILSENYGTSSWCLDELVQIIECKKNNTGTIVLPIFYKVAPADVRRQIGSFGKAFHERESRLRDRGFDPMILKKWKQALEEVSNLRGREANGSEAGLVKSVVQQVLLELKKKFELVIPENLVGIGSHVKKIMKFVDDNSRATVFVGIHGMGGIGKTTLAKTIYNGLSNQFEYRSFIADIRESCERNGIEYLQNQLISDTLKRDYKVSNRDEGIRFMSSNFKNKKVLILLDDVDAEDHLKNLARSRDWFSSGSVIIITTRNKSILDNAEGHYNYELEEMDMETSSILFSRHAFRKDAPPRELEVLTHDVVCTTGGLPLSLEVVGSFLRDKSQGVWEDTIKKLRNIPHKEVQKKLRISYEALDYGQQQIFLDIACFFIGTDLRIASYMWDACDWYPNEGIVVLRLMSLIKVGENHKLKMHDQLRDLGREIVREKGKREPRKCSRLWDSKEVLKVLKEDEGVEKIEAICLGEDSSKGFDETIDQGGNLLTDKQFRKLKNLRFLEANGAEFCGDFEKSILKLKWLQWKKCPSTFEAKNFQAEELRVLNLWGSYISDKWQGWSWIKMAKKLKYLDLSYCPSLEKASFLSTFENLEVLILGHCDGLTQIDSSIGNMKSLVRLELRFCHCLEGLPTEVGRLKALEQLLLQGCGHISSLPSSIGGLHNLEILNICNTGIQELPDSIGDLQNLEILNISDSLIKELPNGIGRLRKLRDLNASYCRQLGGDMPESIRNLSSLQCLNLFGCKELRSLSVLPSSLTYLRVTCQSPRLPSLSNLTRLKELYLRECEFVECIWDHPSTLLEKSLIIPFKLEILEICRCKPMKTLDVSQFNHLRTLTVDSCTHLLEIRGLDQLKYLESLEIRYCDSIERLDLPKSEDLEILNAVCCISLIEIQGLDRLESLKEINISRCAKIARLDLSKSEGLKKFNAQYCENLIEIQGLDRLEFLEVLNMHECTSFGRLPNLCCFDTLHDLAINCWDNLDDIQSLEVFPSLTTLRIDEYNKSLAKFPPFRHLRELYLSHCHEIQEILGLEELTSLEDISFLRCSSLKILPDLSSCTNLKILTVRDCEKLTELRGLEKLEKLRALEISGCKSIKTIPNLRCRTRVDFKPVWEFKDVDWTEFFGRRPPNTESECWTIPIS